jgi:hypothetical protein
MLKAPVDVAKAFQSPNAPLLFGIFLGRLLLTGQPSLMLFTPIQC